MAHHKSIKQQIWQATRTANKTTRDVYRANASHYVEWARDNGITDVSRDSLQMYYNHLADRDLSEATRHNYMAPLCRTAGISYDQIEHQKRTQELTRSRSDMANMQGYNEERSGRFERLVGGQSHIGIRRAELADLRGRNLREDESGYLCVEVEHGKGGKHHLQRLLPEDREHVIELFRGVGRDERVFTDAEMNNKIDLHAKRSEHARRTYDYYEQRLEREPGYAKQLREEIIERYFAEHPKQKRLPKELRYQVVAQSPYRCRGSVKQQAIEHGRPTEYDRLAVIATSVFSLSHWRSNVAIKNYLT